MNKRLVVGVLLVFAIVIGSTALVNAYDSKVCTNNYIFQDSNGDIVICQEFCRYYDGGGTQIGWSCTSTGDCNPCNS
jgi:hypothetical protein